MRATALIDAAGGTIELGAAIVRFPAGAVTEATQITVTATSASAPDAFTAFTPIFELAPGGLALAEAGRIELPFAGASETATIFWTNAEGSAYMALPTRIENGRAVAEFSHFSRAFVGSACSGDDCCGRATSALDVLMVMDNSNSMTEEQHALAEQIPRMAEALATGDLDGDGVQDVPAVESLRMGIVSSDMGTGGHRVPTCEESSFGDDGILRTVHGSAGAECPSTGSAYATFEDGGDPAVFADEVACMAIIGTGGCGFEQQLEASLKALTPSTSELRFRDGAVGHGDTENSGFLRDDSALAVITVTDENDCSSADPELFDPTSGTYTEDLNLRCHFHPEAVHPTSRYVDGLLSLRSSPGRLVFAPIVGVPFDLLGEAVSWDEMMSDPRLVEQPDTTAQTPRLVPSCLDPDRGLAFPPTRILEVARSLEARGAVAAVESLCHSDLTAAVDGILRRVGGSLAGACGPR
jgi:hypothetical protein